MLKKDKVINNKLSFTLFVLFGFIYLNLVYSNSPQNGVVAIDMTELKKVTSKQNPDHEYFSFEELVESGVNTLAIKTYQKASAGSAGTRYTWREWVNEAHEHGLYVVGGLVTDVGLRPMYDQAKHALTRDVDYLQIDEPMNGWSGGCAGRGMDWTQKNYNTVKSEANKACMHGNCPVFVTDVACNDKVGTVDGLIQECYPGWENYWNRVTSYGKNNGCWTWLQSEYDGGVSFSSTDADNEFKTVWNNIGNVYLFIYTYKVPNYNGLTGTHWNTLKNTIKSSVGSKVVKLPVWKNFSQSSTVQSAPDCQIQVRSETDGVNPASVECYYAVGDTVYRNLKWIRHWDVKASGTKGTKDWVTITATGVPFNQLTNPKHNRIRFKIRNNYTGNYYRNNMLVKRDYDVEITALDWTNLSNEGVITALPANLTIDIENAGGLDKATLKCEYSIDGGISWKTHPASITGEDASTSKETVTVLNVPFVEDKAKTNKIRFSIKSKDGTLLSSTSFPVKLLTGPKTSDFSITRDGSKVDFSLKVADSKGLRIGHGNAVNKEETMILLPLSSDFKDVSGYGRHGRAIKGPQITNSTVAGMSKKVAYLDGADDAIDCGVGTMDRADELTLSFWIKAGQEAESWRKPIALGEDGFAQSLVVTTYNNNNLSVVAKNQADKAMPTLTVGSGKFVYDQWHHITIIWDGEFGKLFLNGNLESKQDWSGMHLFMWKPFRLGSDGYWYKRFKGSLSDVHLIGRALTEAEVAADYYSGMYRTSVDSGKTWSEWKKAEIDKTDGATEPATFSATGVELPENEDLMNVIQIAVRDINGNTTGKVFKLMQDGTVSTGKKLTVHSGRIGLQPNPFRVKTNIRFNLNETHVVNVSLFGINGKKVKSLTNEMLSAGSYSLEWDGTNEAGQKLSGGQYFARVQIGKKVVVKKVLMLR
ncbi:MAG: T9SS type A sorting domain-containing protein [Fibrobacteria bacterium]|nr:T9SS type A sorting domain-containing protein [Fibrobacteria bacterium]